MKKTTQPILVKGYKVTDPDMKCRGFQYELNKLYKHEGDIAPCNAGFHFCEIAANCFNHYDFNSSNRVFEIAASGKILKEADKSCAEEIMFVRELTWHEVLTLVNTGMNNSGINNSGHCNSGRRNSGNYNSGNQNSGDYNSGNINSGYYNSGHYNSGHYNSGHRNSGYRNSGHRNSGHYNNGDHNSGDHNSGNRNSGDWNSGNRNSGNYNSGDWNSGYCNSGNYNSGAFCTDLNPKLMLFDKMSSMTVREWKQHPIYEMLYNISPTIWIPKNNMSEDEKKAHSEYEILGGYLKTISMKEAWINFWNELKEDKKQLFTSLENFDKEKFKEITGISI